MIRKIPASSPTAPVTTPAIRRSDRDGFETYGVTSVALIAFLALSLVASPVLCGKLIIWLFAIQSLMVVASLVSYYFNMAIASVRYGGKKNINWERLDRPGLAHLDHLHHRLLCREQVYARRFHDSKNGQRRAHRRAAQSTVVGAFRHHRLRHRGGGLCWAGALIMEFTKIFVSTSSRHVREVTNASGHGGASLNILSGLVAGNFSAFWMGLVILSLMFRRVSVFAECGFPRAHARAIHLRHAHLRVRPRGVRFSR